MKRLKELMASPKAAMAAFAAAVVLLLSSTIGGARAARIYGEENYQTTIETTAISTALLEENAGTKGAEKIGEGSALLTGMIPAGEKIKPGKRYKETLSVENTGETDQYVRVTVYRYWTETVQEGSEGTAPVTEKDRTADPAYIRLHLSGAGDGADIGEAPAGGDWVVDADASTTERTVLYYRNPLGPGERVAFMDGLTIDGAVAGILKEEADGAVSYPYASLSFEVKVEVDAVQPRHAEEAILSAWGREVTIDGEGDLSLAPRRSSVSWEEPSVSGNEGTPAGKTGSGTEDAAGDAAQAGQEGGNAG